MNQFRIKTYGKSELAMLYFPDSCSVHTATTHLMNWIKRNTKLVKALERRGYHPSAKVFTPSQVALIISHLGEP
ncbi:MAG: DUF4248 domain-containing protein [Bacteroidaceae bacterium]|jgi:hypothetical protein|nr:DUF4248 domain-containing protein [Bacteroidaceae bacterium]